MTQKVTKRQQAVLDCIEACIREKGYGPTVREVCQSLGLSSPSTVHVHLKALEDKGFIKRDPLKSRSIALTYPIEEVPSPVTAFAAAYSKLVNVPLVGNVAAGSPILAEENITDTITLPTDIVGDAPSFMLSVRGESMIEAGINDGDYVVVKEQPVANNGDIVVAIIDDDERIVPEFIAAYIAFFDAHPSVASAGGPIVAEYPAGRPAWMSRYTERPIANPIDLGPTPRPFPRGRIPGGGNMALRRTALGRYGAFDPQLGRRGARLLGGEESDLFARLRRGGEQCWYVPGAVMYHIIPPSKLTRGYFDRLCRNIGVSQRTRAAIDGGLLRLWTGEAAKWCATLGIALGYCLTGRVRRAAWLVRMRRQITAGLLTSAE